MIVCKNNSEKSSTTTGEVDEQVGEHISSGFSLSTISSFIDIENNHDIYKDMDWMKKFCEFLRELTIKIINFKKK